MWGSQIGSSYSDLPPQSTKGFHPSYYGMSAPAPTSLEQHPYASYDYGYDNDSSDDSDYPYVRDRYYCYSPPNHVDSNITYHSNQYIHNFSSSNVSTGYANYYGSHDETDSAHSPSHHPYQTFNQFPNYNWYASLTYGNTLVDKHREVEEQHQETNPYVIDWIDDNLREQMLALLRGNENGAKINSPEEEAVHHESEQRLNDVADDDDKERHLDDDEEDDDEDQDEEELMPLKSISGTMETMLSKYLMTMLNAPLFIRMPIFEFINQCMAVGGETTLLGDIILVKYYSHSDGVEQALGAHKLPSLLATKLHNLEVAEATATTEIPSTVATIETATAAVIFSAEVIAVVAAGPKWFSHNFSPHYASCNSLKILLQYKFAKLQLGGLISVRNNVEVYASCVSAVFGWLIVINTYKDKEERTLQALIGEILVNYLLSILVAAVANVFAVVVVETAGTAYTFSVDGLNQFIFILVLLSQLLTGLQKETALQCLLFHHFWENLCMVIAIEAIDCQHRFSPHSEFFQILGGFMSFAIPVLYGSNSDKASHLICGSSSVSALDETKFYEWLITWGVYFWIRLVHITTTFVPTWDGKEHVIS